MKRRLTSCFLPSFVISVQLHPIRCLTFGIWRPLWQRLDTHLVAKKLNDTTARSDSLQTSFQRAAAKQEQLRRPQTLRHLFISFFYELHQKRWALKFNDSSSPAGGCAQAGGLKRPQTSSLPLLRCPPSPRPPESNYRGRSWPCGRRSSRGRSWACSIRPAGRWGPGRRCSGPPRHTARSRWSKLREAEEKLRGR